MSDTHLPEASAMRRVRVRNDRRPWICAERASHGWMDLKVGVWNPCQIDALWRILSTS